MKLEIAQQYAEEMCTALEPYCLPGRCQIAGSVRRKKPEVGDIEIVALPKREQITAFWLAALKFGKQGGKIKADTRYVKVSRPTPYGNLQYDIFVPQPYDWGRILAIRTGDADFSHKEYATRWVQKGYRGTEHGLLPESHCVQSHGKWKIKQGVNPEACRITFQEEQDFFNWLGMEWVEPENRTTQ